MRNIFGPVLLALVVTAFSGDDVFAAGRDLDGQMAPDMSFREGFNGFEKGTTLSAHRGKVVWVKFWLKDCPICHRQLKEVQDLYDRYGTSGLQVLTVVHEHRPDVVRGKLRTLNPRYDFPVACDRDGSQAAKYGVGRRPVDYVIGTDGRVKSSNKMSVPIIEQELRRYRLQQLGKVPASFKTIREDVWHGRLGHALLLSERAMKAEDVTAEEEAAAAKVTTLARETMEARARAADRLFASGDRRGARGAYERLVGAFTNTSLHDEAKALRDAFLAKAGN